MFSTISGIAEVAVLHQNSIAQSDSFPSIGNFELELG